VMRLLGAAAGCGHGSRRAGQVPALLTMRVRERIATPVIPAKAAVKKLAPRVRRPGHDLGVVPAEAPGPIRRSISRGHGCMGPRFRASGCTDLCGQGRNASHSFSPSGRRGDEGLGRCDSESSSPPHPTLSPSGRGSEAPCPPYKKKCVHSLALSRGRPRRQYLHTLFRGDDREVISARAPAAERWVEAAMLRGRSGRSDSRSRPSCRQRAPSSP
jgi:hypothetical protein